MRCNKPAFSSLETCSDVLLSLIYRYEEMEPIVLGSFSFRHRRMAYWRPLTPSARIFFQYRLKSRIIQIKELPPGGRIGYDARVSSEGAVRAAVVPFGFSNGYPRVPAGGSVLVEGLRAPIMGMRGTEHTMLDVSRVPKARVGSEVVLLGRQGKEEITAEELTGLTGMPMIELVPRLARGSPRVYLK